MCHIWKCAIFGNGPYLEMGHIWKCAIFGARVNFVLVCNKMYLEIASEKQFLCVIFAHKNIAGGYICMS